MPQDAARRPPGGRFGPFRHRSYLVYWLGVSITSLGTWLQAVAGSIYIYQLTGSTFVVGIFNFAGFIPILLFSVWGGQLSDRFDRRRVVWTSHAASMAIATILAVLTIAGAATVISLIVAMFLLNVLWALGKPSLLSLVPNIVPRGDLQDAVALTSLGFLAGQIVGPLIAAGAMAASGAGLAFAVNALTYGAPIVSMFYLGRLGLGGRAARSDGSAGPLERGPSAVTFLRKNLWMSGLLAGIVVTSMGMEIQRTLAPGLVFEKLGIPESNAGLLVAAQSVGSAIALLLFVQIRKFGWSRRSAFIGLLTQALGVLVAASAPDLTIALIGFGFIGLGFALCFPVLTAALQGATPDELRGRVMSFHQLALLGHRPVTALVIGSVATGFSLLSATLIWLTLVPLGLLAVRTAWRRLPEEPAPGHHVDGPDDAATEIAQRSIAER
jgi:MFS family permease